MGRQADFLEDGLGRALHADLLGPRLERPGFAVEQVAGGVGRVDLLEEQVLGVRSGVRGAPRDACVVTERDRRDARERGARHVVRTGVGDRRAMEPVQEPDRGHRDPEVRVIREERAAGRGQARRDDPVVRTHAVHADHAITYVQPRDAADRVAEVGDRAPADCLRLRRLVTNGGRGGVRRVTDVRRVARARHDHRSAVRIGREQLVGAGRVAETGISEVPEQLLVHVGADVPRLRPSASRPSRGASTVPASCPSGGTRAPGCPVPGRATR